MALGSDNPFPSMLYVEQGSTPTSPSASRQRLFVRSSDHVLCMVNSSGTVTALSGSLTNPMTTGGDIIYGGSSGAPTRLANGSSGQVLTSAGGTSAPTWAAPVPTILRASLSGNVTLTTAHAWTDLVSLVLGSAANYQILARGQILVGASNGWGYLRLIDGAAAVFGAGEQYSTSATASTAPILAWGVVAGSQTIKLQGSSDSNSGTAQRYPQDNAAAGISTSPITEIVAIPTTA